MRATSIMSFVTLLPLLLIQQQLGPSACDAIPLALNPQEFQDFLPHIMGHDAASGMDATQPPTSTPQAEGTNAEGTLGLSDNLANSAAAIPLTSDSDAPTASENEKILAGKIPVLTERSLPSETAAESSVPEQHVAEAEAPSQGPSSSDVAMYAGK
jgi:hypothetical protein